jgi:hypothetical protein
MRHYVGTWPQSVEDMDVYSSGRDGRLDYLHRPPSLPSIPSANQIYRQPIRSTVSPVRQSNLPSVPSAPSTPSAPSANQIYRPCQVYRQPTRSTVRPVSPVSHPVSQPDLPSRFPSTNQIYRPHRQPIRSTDQALSPISLTHRVSMMRHVTSWADLPVESKLMILGHCLRFPDYIIESDHRFHVEDGLLAVVLTSNGMHVLGCEQYYANTFVGRCSSKLELYAVCFCSLPHCSIGV